ncbi:MAG: twin-arginine translocation pathway signal [Comamonadaceae bacterium]|nr:MAG: twin-arginine translocation pathway signal [Comamonadaceae bacterium]
MHVFRRVRCLGRILSIIIAAQALSLAAITAVHAQPRSAADAQAMVLVGQDYWLFPGWGSLTNVDLKGVEQSTVLIQAARDALARRNIQLVVVVLPEKTLFYADKLPAGKSVSSEVRARYRNIQDSLTRAGVPSFDGEQLMRGILAQGQDVFYRTDQHWTQAAADACAVATATLVKRVTPTLHGAAGSGMKLGAPTVERRYGDMAELFLTPAQRTAAGRETFNVRKNSPGQALLDDGPAPVHVTGHSMVQPYFGFPQKLSEQLDRPVSVNWKPGNVGPWIMLMEYLESSAFRKSPPQVLVWQMFEPTYSQGPQATGLWDNASIMSAATWRSRMLVATQP